MSATQPTLAGIGSEIVEVVAFHALPGRCAELRQAGWHPWRLERMADGYELTAVHWPGALDALHSWRQAHRNTTDHDNIAGEGSDVTTGQRCALNGMFNY